MRGTDRDGDARRQEEDVLSLRDWQREGWGVWGGGKRAINIISVRWLG